MRLTSTFFRLAPALIALMPLAAQAATVSFTGQAGSGTDPIGGNTFLGDIGGGLNAFQEITGIQADPTQSAVTLNLAGTGLADVTSFTLTLTGAGTILSPDAGYGIAFQTYTSSGAITGQWTATLTADAKSITYAADTAADALVSGQGFNTYSTVLTGGAPVSGLTYSVTWAGDAVSPAPEAASWAMMIAGFGMVGAVARRCRKTPMASAAA